MKIMGKTDISMIFNLDLWFAILYIGMFYSVWLVFVNKLSDQKCSFKTEYESSPIMGMNSFI